MNSKLLNSILICILVAIISGFFIWNNNRSSNIDEQYLPYLQSLDSIISPINNSPNKITDKELESLFLSDCKIIGLGEATHGTKEFFQIKHRIFKYLVENHNCRIFAFECDMGESYYVDKYVTEGIGDIDKLMKETMHFWTWRTKEVKELLLWMKEFNETQEPESKNNFRIF